MMKKWPSIKTVTFCPYCSKATQKIRFNFDTGNKKNIVCDSCKREFGLFSFGAQNLKTYLDLVLFASNEIDKTNFSQGLKVFCPIDGRGSLKKISEAVSADVDEDVDIEIFHQCRYCKRRFTLMVFNLQNEEDKKYWASISGV